MRERETNTRDARLPIRALSWIFFLARAPLSCAPLCCEKITNSHTASECTGMFSRSVACAVCAGQQVSNFNSRARERVCIGACVGECVSVCVCRCCSGEERLGCASAQQKQKQQQLSSFIVSQSPLFTIHHDHHLRQIGSLLRHTQHPLTTLPYDHHTSTANASTTHTKW